MTEYKTICINCLIKKINNIHYINDNNHSKKSKLYTDCQNCKMTVCNDCAYINKNTDVILCPICMSFKKN